ncbi:hypothetical protein GCM10027447_23210 [Glycomyces halotolerans]
MTTDSNRAICLKGGRIVVRAEVTFQNLLDAIYTAPAHELARCWKALLRQALRRRRMP